MTEAGGARGLPATRCRRCGGAFFPPRRICPTCFADDTMEPLKLGGRGTIYSLSIVRLPPPDGRPVPYAVGYVDLADPGLRIFTRFAGCAPEALRVGMAVELAADTESDRRGGQPNYVFRPVRPDGP